MYKFPARSSSLQNVKKAGAAPTRIRSESDPSMSSSESSLPWNESPNAEVLAEKQRMCTKYEDRDSCNYYARAFCKENKVSRKTEQEMMRFLAYATRQRILKPDATRSDVEKMCSAFHQGL